jgi:hypothetical protein
MSDSCALERAGTACRGLFDVPVAPTSAARDREHDVVGRVSRRVGGMAARHRQTEEHRHGAIVIALRGLARGDDLGDVAGRLEPLHPRHDTFHSELLLDLAADAIGICGASGHSPLEFEGIRERHLPEGDRAHQGPTAEEQSSVAGWHRPALTDDRRGLAQYGETKGR